MLKKTISMFMLLCVSSIRMSVCAYHKKYSAHEAPIISNKQRQREFGVMDKKWQNRIKRFEFFQKLEKESKLTSYPALQLEELLRAGYDTKI